MLVSDAELFRHISDEINFVLDTIKGKTKEEALNDGILFRALVRSIEIIGEASKKISSEFKGAHPEIEWKKIAGTRDILAHVYFALDNDIIWDIITEKLPPFGIFISRYTAE
jgi:hypothetical protein